jgi:hypothetical protein
MDRAQPKQLRMALSPVPNSGDTALELTWGRREIGALTLHPDDVAEFIECVRDGFPVVVIGAEPRAAKERQQQRDTAEFTSGLEPDEQDD